MKIVMLLYSAAFLAAGFWLGWLYALALNKDRIRCERCFFTGPIFMKEKKDIIAMHYQVCPGKLMSRYGEYVSMLSGMGFGGLVGIISTVAFVLRWMKP